MKRLYVILSNIIMCFGIINFAFAENTEDISNSESDNESIIKLDLTYKPYFHAEENISYNIYKYGTKDDLLDFISNPYIAAFSKSLNKENMYSYALPYHSNVFEYDITSSPVEKYSAGITSFSLKSMNIFNTYDYDTAIYDTVYSLIISSVLGLATKDLIGLNIWSGTDNYGVSGFQAIVRPFKNLQLAYSYLTDQNYKRTIIKLNFGYKKYSNIACKSMNTFNDHYINSTFGVEWQFYF